MFVRECNTLEYRNIMKFIGYVLADQKNFSEKQQKIYALQTISKAIKQDLQSDLLTELIYSGQSVLPEEIDFSYPLPLYYSDKKGKEICLVEKNTEKITISLNENNVFILPWNYDRFSGAINHINEAGFVYDKQNHMANYYRDVDFCFVYNGLHHTAVATLLKQGKIKADVIDITKLYPLMDVNPDGQFYHISSMKITDENPDFRIAAIYKIARIIWNLKQEKTTMAKKLYAQLQRYTRQLK